MSSRKKKSIGIVILVLVFIILSVYQIYYVAHLSDALNLEYGADVTFEEVKQRLENEMDQLWLIDIAQVVFASLVLLALYMNARFLRLELNLHKSFRASEEETNEDFVEQEQEEIKCRIENVEEHKQILISLKSDFEAMINHIAMATSASSALMYELNDDTLNPVGSFATVKKYSFYSPFKIGVGVVGEVAKSKHPIVMDDVNTTELVVSSGLGKTLPKQLIVLPLFFEDDLVGVVELSFLDSLTDEEQEKLRELCDID